MTWGREPASDGRDRSVRRAQQAFAATVALARLAVLGGLVGVIAGLASAGFLASLDWATTTRERHGWLLWLLPLAGFVVGAAYHYGGGRSGRGNALVIEEIHQPAEFLPRRMAPLIFAATIVTHLFGGSAGREGTALQMSASLTDASARALRITPAERRLLLIAALSGGFGAVFGVPVAGVAFGLEVQTIGRLRYDALLPALVASVVGDAVVAACGVDHSAFPAVDAVSLGPLLVAKLVAAGVAFGVIARAFVASVHGVRSLATRLVAWPPLRPVCGGLAVIGLTGALGTRDYLGLSIPLATAALAGGAGIAAYGFAAKLALTALTLGSGFQGGEVTPLFVIGATAGVSVARLLGAPVALLAAVGFVAVFAAAANTPLACTLMAVELFGAQLALPALIGCVVAYLCSSHQGIYATQRVDSAKQPGPAQPPSSL